MFRLLPWSSAVGGSKVTAEEIKMFATPPRCASPGLAGFALPCLKRKRSDSSDSLARVHAPVAPKLRKGNSPTSREPSLCDTPELTASRDTTTPSDSASELSLGPSRSQHRSAAESAVAADSAPTPSQFTVASRKMDVERLRETLDAQISLEILLKHNELRLIDQEIAKCQVALEQLRRCAEIPYFGSSVAGVSQSLSDGQGPAVRVPGNGPSPLSPAPWGVTDGPYSRHYAKWLLPDPRFDGGPVESDSAFVAGPSGSPFPSGRSTRGTLGDGVYGAGKTTRPQRGSSLSTRLQSLPSGYPAPKEKAGPMIIRRKSDGVLVKLVCLDCRRDNFSSTQGFINHCRIAHNRNFASHDAAAVASGEPVEVDQAGSVVAPATTSTPSQPATPGSVHPLIRSAHGMKSAAAAAAAGSVGPAADRGRSVGGNPTGLSRRQRRPASERSAPPFEPSPEAPHLSSLIQQRGIGVDFGELLGEATQAVDLAAYSSGAESDGESSAPSPVVAQDRVSSGSPRARQPTRTTSTRRPGSRKGLAKVMHKPSPLEPSSAPYTSPYGPATQDTLHDEEGLDLSADLSPHTVESNQAPSLVSDDEDEDEEYEAPSESEHPSPTSSDADGSDHVEVEDDEHSTTATPPRHKSAVHHLTNSARPLRRGPGKRRDSFLAPSVVSLDRGEEEAEKTKKKQRVTVLRRGNTPTARTDGGRRDRRRHPRR